MMMCYNVAMNRFYLHSAGISAAYKQPSPLQARVDECQAGKQTNVVI